MKRGTKLLVLLGVLVLLGLAVWLLPKMEQGGGKTTEDSAETAGSAAVLTLNAADVTGMSWDYQGVTLYFTCGESWQYPADADFTPDAAILDALLDSVCAITASKTITDPEALSAYGLDVPELTVVLTRNSGEETLSFGDLSGTGEECYFQNGDGNVYLVDPTVKEQFFLSLLDVVQPEELPELGGMTELTVETGDGKLHLHQASGQWYAEDTLLSVQRTEDFLDTVRSTAWLACVCYDADELDLQVFGLDEPAGTVTISEDGKTLLALEITEDGYARICGSRLIYSVSTQLCDTLLYTTVPELLPDEVLATDWDRVERLDMTMNGEVYSAVRQETDGDGQSWEIQGLVTDLAALRDTLDDMTGSYALGAKPERKLKLQIEVKEDSGDMQTLCFYPYDSSSYLVQQDGVSTVFITHSQMEELLSAILVLIS